MHRESGLAAHRSIETTSTTTRPRRVLLVGDSLMYQAGPGLEDALRALGAEVHVQAIPGSGLLQPSTTWWHHWLDDMTRLVDDEHPDVVVAEFVGNYNGPRALDALGHEIVARSDAFYQAWLAASDEAVRRLTGPDGRYAPTAVAPDGTVATVRAPDGVHFGDAGTKRVIAATVDALRAAL